MAENSKDNLDEATSTKNALFKAAGISKGIGEKFNHVLASFDSQIETTTNTQRTATNPSDDDVASDAETYSIASDELPNENPDLQSFETIPSDACLKKLMAEGKDLTQITEEGECLLSLASANGYLDLVQVMLAMNRDSVDERGPKNDLTPLMESVINGHESCAKALIEHGANVNAQSENGNTPLHYACANGHVSIARELLDKGAGIEDQNENGHTPLMEAASNGLVEVAKLLLERGAGINAYSSEFKESALTLACYKGHYDMVKFLLGAGADQDHQTEEMHTALMEACMDGHYDVAKLLIDHGAKVNMPTESFESPLTLAACGGHLQLANLLIEKGASLEEVNDEGYSPLMEAAREGHEAMVMLLVNCGANVNAQTEETQETALTLACYNGFVNIAKYLLDAGADVNGGGSSPLMEAAHQGHVDLVKFLISSGADLHLETGGGETALSFACENGHNEVAEILLNCGAKLEHESEGGRTPLMKAARAGHVGTVQFLVSRGADVNRLSQNEDHTPLSLACSGDHKNVVELLLEHDADPSIRLKDGSNALIEATKAGNTQIVRLLLEYSPSSIDTLPDTQELMNGCEIQPRVPTQALPNMVPPAQQQQTQIGVNATRNSMFNQNSICQVHNYNCPAMNTNPRYFNNNNPANSNVSLNSPPQQQTQLSSNQLIQHQQPPPAFDCSQQQHQQQHPVQETQTSPSEVQYNNSGSNNSSTGSSSSNATNCVSSSSPPGSNSNTAVCGRGVHHTDKDDDDELDSNACHCDESNYHAAEQEIAKNLQREKNELLKKNARLLNEKTEMCKNVHAVKQYMEQQVHAAQILKENYEEQAANYLLPSKTSPAYQLPNPKSTNTDASSNQPTDNNLQQQLNTTTGCQHTNPSSVEIRKTSSPVAEDFSTCSDTAGNLVNWETFTTVKNPNVAFLEGGFSAMNPLAACNFSKKGIPKVDNNKQCLSNNLNRSTSQTTTATTTSTCANVTAPLHHQHSNNCCNLSQQHTNASVINPALAGMNFDAGAAIENIDVNFPLPMVPNYQFNNAGLDSAILEKLKQLPEAEQRKLLELTNSLATAIDTAVTSPEIATLLQLASQQKLPLINNSSSSPVTSPQSLAANFNFNHGSTLATGATTLTMGHAGSQASDLFNAESVIGLMAAAGVDYSDPNGIIASQRVFDLLNQGYANESQLAASFGRIALNTNESDICQSGQLLLAPNPSPTEGVSSPNRPSSPCDNIQPSRGGYKQGDTLYQTVASANPVTAAAMIAGVASSNISYPAMTPEQIMNLNNNATANRTTQTSGMNNAPLFNASNSASNIIPQTEIAPPTTCSQNARTLVEVNAQTDSNNDTPLTIAAAAGNRDIVRELLRSKAAIEHKDKKGFTPLILAASGGHVDVVRLLLDNEGQLEATSERTKDTALSLACSGGKDEVVSVLLEKGANIEHRNVSDYTPLSLAASGGYIKIIRMLLNAGAEINSRTGSKLGISPLMLAAMNGHTDAVKLLLDHGSDINAQIESNRNTALTLACYQGRHEVVSLLLERRANMEHRAKSGLTPLMEAASGGYADVGRVLLDHGADVNAPPVPASRDTALTIAADKGHYNFCEVVVARGANVEARNKKGGTPLWLACNGGHLDVAMMLVTSGADVDAHDNRKISCLMAAFRRGHVKVLRYLVKKVSQFPGNLECLRYIATLSDNDLIKRCNQCLDIITNAKDKQAEQANKNATSLLQELDDEKCREEKQKEAAARKREKRRQKKKQQKSSSIVNNSTEGDNDGKESADEEDSAADKENESNSIEAMKQGTVNSMKRGVAGGGISATPTGGGGNNTNWKKNIDDKVESANYLDFASLLSLPDDIYLSSSGNSSSQANWNHTANVSNLSASHKKRNKRDQPTSIASANAMSSSTPALSPRRSKNKRNQNMSTTTTNTTAVFIANGSTSKITRDYSPIRAKNRESYGSLIVVAGGHQMNKKSGGSSSRSVSGGTSGNKQKLPSSKQQSAHHQASLNEAIAAYRTNSNTTTTNNDKKRNADKGAQKLEGVVTNGVQESNRVSHYGGNTISENNLSSSKGASTVAVSTSSYAGSKSVAMNNSHNASSRYYSTTGSGTTPGSGKTQFAASIDSHANSSHNSNSRVNTNSAQQSYSSSSSSAPYHTSHQTNVSNTSSSSFSSVVTTATAANVAAISTNNNNTNASLNGSSGNTNHLSVVTPQTSRSNVTGNAVSPRKPVRRGDEGWKEVTVSRKSLISKKTIVPGSAISRVIGRQGCNINAIREATCAHIEIDKQQQKGQVDRIVNIRGSAESVKWAEKLIDILVQDPAVDITEHIPKNLAQSLSGGGSGNSSLSNSVNCGGGVSGASAKKVNNSTMHSSSNNVTSSMSNTSVYSNPQHSMAAPTQKQTPGHQPQPNVPVSVSGTQLYDSAGVPSASGFGTNSSIAKNSTTSKTPSVGVIGSKPGSQSSVAYRTVQNSASSVSGVPTAYQAQSVWKNSGASAAGGVTDRDNSSSNSNSTLLKNILYQGPSTKIWPDLNANLSEKNNDSRNFSNFPPPIERPAHGSSKDMAKNNLSNNSQLGVRGPNKPPSGNSLLTTGLTSAMSNSNDVNFSNDSATADHLFLSSNGSGTNSTSSADMNQPVSTVSNQMNTNHRYPICSPPAVVNKSSHVANGGGGDDSTCSSSQVSTCSPHAAGDITSHQPHSHNSHQNSPKVSPPLNPPNPSSTSVNAPSLSSYHQAPEITPQKDSNAVHSAVIGQDISPRLANAQPGTPVLSQNQNSEKKTPAPIGTERARAAKSLQTSHNNHGLTQSGSQSLGLMSSMESNCNSDMFPISNFAPHNLDKNSSGSLTGSFNPMNLHSHSPAAQLPLSMSSNHAHSLTMSNTTGLFSNLSLCGNNGSVSGTPVPHSLPSSTCSNLNLNNNYVNHSMMSNLDKMDSSNLQASMRAPPLNNDNHNTAPIAVNQSIPNLYSQANMNLSAQQLAPPQVNSHHMSGIMGPGGINNFGGQTLNGPPITNHQYYHHASSMSHSHSQQQNNQQHATPSNLMLHHAGLLQGGGVHGLNNNNLLHHSSSNSSANLMGSMQNGFMHPPPQFANTTPGGPNSGPSSFSHTGLSSVAAVAAANNMDLSSFSQAYSSAGPYHPYNTGGFDCNPPPQMMLDDHASQHLMMQQNTAADQMFWNNPPGCDEYSQL